MILKRLVVILFIQFYLVSVFGFTLSHRVCCDDPQASPVSTAGYSAADMTCHPADKPQQIFLPDCNLCDTGEPPPTKDNCCPDCETIGISILPGKNDQPQYHDPGVPSGPKYPGMQHIAVLPWMAPAVPSIGSLFHRILIPEQIHTGAAGDIPIFIRDCTYRI